MLTISDASEVPWCLEMPDAVHRAFWTPSDGGWLTALVDTVDTSDEGTSSFRCGPHQVRASLDDLRSGIVKPWRERSLFGAPVCRWCQEDADLDDDMANMADDPHRSEAEHSEGSAS